MKKIQFLLMLMPLILGAKISAQNTLLEIIAPNNIAGNLNFGATDGTWGYNLINATDKVSGNVAIAIDSTQYDSTSQLLNCGGTSSSVKGKFALIRRGNCGFSLKAYNAQKAGAIGAIMYLGHNDPQTVFTLGAGDSASAVNIPVFLITYVDAQKMVNAIDSGTTVTVNYRYKTLFSAALNENYATPVNQNLILSPFISASISSTPSLQAQLNITEPDGNIVNSGMVQGILDPNDSTQLVYVFQTYMPTKLGKYHLSVTNNLNADVYRDSFITTQYTFAQDEEGPADDYTGLDAASFYKGGLILDVGHFFYTGLNAGQATYGVYAIHNPKSFIKGDAFTLQLFQISDALFQKFGQQTLTYDDLTAIATAQYNVTGYENTPDSLISVPFKTPVQLNDSSVYLLVVRYNGIATGNTNCPLYCTSGSNATPYYYTDLVYAYDGLSQNRFFSGWGGPENIVRLETMGYSPGAVDTKTVESWTDNQVILSPNPVVNQINLNFDLQTLNPTVDISITNAAGVVMQTNQLKNIQKGSQTLDVSNLSSGLYFARLLGNDGWNTKAFIVTK